MTARTRWWALTAVSLATLMSYLDNNVVNVALPTIERSLDLSVSGLEWIVSSYLLVLGSLLLVGGRVADVFGRRRVFLAGLVIFTLSSLAAGLAGSADVLIAARAVQGLGAALVMPASLAIIAATFTNSRERAAAIGIWGAVGALGLALGPVIGGLVSQHLHWGWIFLINVPLGVITAVLAFLFVAESHGRTVAETEARGARSTAALLDIPGLVSSALALFALTYALIEGQDKGWTSPVITAAFAIAAVGAAIFVAIEARSSHPMVPLPIFRSAAFSGGLGTMMIWSFGVLGIYFFTSLYLQGILGFSPTKAGLSFVPMALCLAVAAMLSPRVSAIIGGHRTVALGMAIMTVGLVLFAGLGAGAAFSALLPGFVLFGLGAGLMNVPLTNAVIDGATTEQAGIASALLNASREVAGLLGVTVVGAVLRSSEGSALRGGARPAQAFIDGYHSGLWLTIGLLAAGVVLSYLTLRPRRRAMLPQEEAPVSAFGEATAVEGTRAVPETTAVPRATAAPRGR
jgi:EmrB/QacA subfamily drug resistance transporter